MAIYTTQYRMVNGYYQPVQVDQFGTPAYGASGEPMLGSYMAPSGGTGAAGGATLGGAGTGSTGGGYASVLDYARDAVSRSPQVASPTLQQAGLSDFARNYPNYMRNLGEVNAQQAFQGQVNQGIRQGNAGNAYQAALMNRNTSRLGYLGQAGQAQLGVDTTSAGLLNDYQKLLLERYARDIMQRDSDLSTYRSAMLGGMEADSRRSAPGTLGTSSMAEQTASLERQGQYGGGKIELGSTPRASSSYIPLRTGIETYYGGY